MDESKDKCVRCVEGGGKNALEVRGGGGGKHGMKEGRGAHSTSMSTDNL